LTSTQYRIELTRVFSKLHVTEVTNQIQPCAFFWRKCEIASDLPFFLVREPPAPFEFEPLDYGLSLFKRGDCLRLITLS
jgi:hypothetical protein